MKISERNVEFFYVREKNYSWKIRKPGFFYQKSTDNLKVC